MQASSTKPFKIPLKRTEHFYLLKQSVFYKLRNINTLCDLLNYKFNFIQQLLSQLNLYYNHSTQIIKNKPRSISYPKDQLYLIHNRIASIFSRIKTPVYLHSSKKGYSYVTNAIVHKESKEVFTCDLKDFFPLTTKSIIFRFFRNQLQCSHVIANILSELCVTKDNHLPIGSQLSQILAFGANKMMFDELSQLAKKHKLLFTVYVDDITFSGNKIPKGFQNIVWNIVYKHGHRLNRKKSRLYLKHQPREITGIIIREGELTISNRIYKKLTAMMNTLETGQNPKDISILKNNISIKDSTLGMLYYIIQFEPKYVYLIKKLNYWGNFSLRKNIELTKGS